jgi:hypothetical protein
MTKYVIGGDLYIVWSVLRRVHILFQSECSRDCDLVLPLWNSSIFSLLSSSSCMRLLLLLLLFLLLLLLLLTFLLLLLLLLALNIVPYIRSSITCFRRLFLWKMWPTHFPFHYSIVRRMYPPLSHFKIAYFFIFHMIGRNDFLHSSPAPYLKTSRISDLFSEVSGFNTIQNYAYNFMFCWSCISVQSL